jgi:hypothetical protein
MVLVRRRLESGIHGHEQRRLEEAPGRARVPEVETNGAGASPYRDKLEIATSTRSPPFHIKPDPMGRAASP